MQRLLDQKPELESQWETAWRAVERIHEAGLTELYASLNYNVLWPPTGITLQVQPGTRAVAQQIMEMFPDSSIAQRTFNRDTYDGNPHIRYRLTWQGIVIDLYGVPLEREQFTDSELVEMLLEVRA